MPTIRNDGEVEAEIHDQAVNLVKKSVNMDEAKGLVLAQEGWHQGVVGIVASRVMQRFHRPVFLLAIDGKEAHGSGRSIEGLNLADSLNAAAHLLVKHGGHQAAAGLTIETENIEEFRESFNEYASEHLSQEDLVPKVDIDFEAQASFLTLNAIQELSLAGAFRTGQSLAPTGNSRARASTPAASHGQRETTPEIVCDGWTARARCGGMGDGRIRNRVEGAERVCRSGWLPSNQRMGWTEFAPTINQGHPQNRPSRTSSRVSNGGYR